MMNIIHVASLPISLANLIAEYTPLANEVTPSDFGFIGDENCASLADFKIGPSSEGAVFLSLEDILVKADDFEECSEDLFVHLLENPDDPDEITWELYNQEALLEKEAILNNNDSQSCGHTLH